jgi:hypothetical protein
MKNLSATAKIVMGLVALLGVFVVLVVADLGVNAGLIHYGVRVGHIDVGGMTPAEAERVIGEVGTEMQTTPIVFSSEGLGPYTWTPEELGWEPRKLDLAERAMKVGRRSDIFLSFGDRIKSWFKGIKIRWERPDRGVVRREVREIADEAELIGLVVDKAKMQYLIRKATWDWPREPVYAIPFKS